MKRARDVERVAGAVQEVGIAERDVSGAGVDELADIGHDDVAIDDEEAPAVHGRDRAVTAVMLAAATGLDVAGQLEAAVSTLEVRVLLEAPKERARWGREVELREDRSRRSARPDRSAIRGGLEMAGQLDERVFHFAAHDGVRAVSQEMLGIQRRVQAVEADVGRRIFLAHARGDPDAEAQRRVHRHGDRDEARAANALGIEGLDGHVEHGWPIAGALEEGRRPRHGQRLVAQLVAADEEDRAGLAHARHSTPAFAAGCIVRPNSSEEACR